MADNKISILVQAEVAKALADLGKVEKSATGIDSKFTKTFAGLKAGFAGIAAIVGGTVVAALGAATKKGIEFLDLNSDFIAVFAGVEKEAIAMRDALVGAYGFSLQEATKLLGTSGQLAQNLGFTADQALRLSGDMAKLASSLALSSTSGLTAEQATQALTSALNGQTRGLRELNISVTETDIKNEALARGLTETELATNKAAKAQIIFDLALKNSGQSLEAQDVSALSLSEKLERVGKFADNVVTIFGVELARSLSGVIDGITKFTQSVGVLDKVEVGARKVIEAFKLFGTAVIAIPLLLTTGLTDIVRGVLNAGQAFSQLGDIVKAAISGKGTEAFEKLKATITDTFKSSLTGGVISSYFDTALSLFTNFETKATEIAKAGGAARNLSRQEEIYEYQRMQDQLDADIETRAAGRAEREAAELEVRKQAIFATVQASLSLAQQATDIIGQIAQRSIDTTNVANEQLLALDAARREELRARDQVDFDQQVLSLEAQIAAAKKKGDKETADRLQQQLDRIKNDKAYQDRKFQLEKEAAEKEKEIKKKQWLANKAVQISQAIMNTAGAVIAALVNPVPFAGPALAIAAGITGGIQTAIIASEPMPAFAEGGMAGLQGPQMIMAGERGREAVLPNELTEMLMRAAGQGGGGSTINIGQVVANNPEQFSKQLDGFMRSRGREIPV